MQESIKQEAFQTPRWWQECYRAFFGHVPGPQGSGYLELLTSQSGPAHLTVIAKSSNHVEARDLALERYAECGSSAPILGCLVYGPCREPGCGCSGTGCGMAFLVAYGGTIH